MTEGTGRMGRPGVMLDPAFPQYGDRFHSLLHTENTYPFVPETLISANREPGRSSASGMHRGCVLRQERFLPSELLTVRGGDRPQTTHKGAGLASSTPNPPSSGPFAPPHVPLHHSHQTIASRLCSCFCPAPPTSHHHGPARGPVQNDKQITCLPAQNLCWLPKP